MSKIETYSTENIPMVSVIVRTCGRPEVLFECLKSIENQTYKNIEVCIAEDGEAVSESYIKKHFPNMNIKYTATVEKKGRSFTGNLAMSMASGVWFNFLDDDDIFYKDHIETMVKESQKNKNASILYAMAHEAETEIISLSPYVYVTHKCYKPYFKKYSKENLIINNLFPIQTVFFKKEVFEELGGFDTKYDYLEDWDMWLKFSQKYEFFPIDKVTSLYRIPSNKSKTKKRTDLLKQNERDIRKKYLKKEYALSDFKKEAQHLSKLKFYFDNADIYNDFEIKVEGWCFIKDTDCELIDIYLRIEDTNKIFKCFGTERCERSDVAEKFDDKKYLKSGFWTIVPFKNYGIEKIKKIDVVAVCGDNLYYNKNLKLCIDSSQKNNLLKKVVKIVGNIKRKIIH